MNTKANGKSEKGKNSNKRTSKTQKIFMQNILSFVFIAVVFVGAVGFGVGLILSEIRYPQADSFFECPLSYRIFMYVALGVSNGGLIGCAFTKNRRNTAPLECKIWLAVFIIGFLYEAAFGLAGDTSFANGLSICIGATVSAVGFFCGVGSLIGSLKKPRRSYGQIYGELFSSTLEYRPLPRGATLLQIMRTEAYLGTMLPGELVDFLLEFNGDGELMFSAEEMIEKTEKARKTHKNAANEDAFNLCFIGTDGSGNYYCYKISDGSVEEGEIYLWHSETDATVPAAATLAELIVSHYTRPATSSTHPATPSN